MSDLDSFNSIPGELRAELYRCLPVPEDTDQVSIIKLQNLYHLRHDIAHFICEALVGIKSDFTVMKKLSEQFPFLPESFLKLSPDIFFERNGTIVFIDISVSHNYEFNFNEKAAKYTPVLNFLSEQGFETLPFYMAWFHPSWSNVNNSLKNLEIFLNNNSLPFYPLPVRLLDTVSQFYERVSTLIQELRRKTPTQLLNFFDRLEQPEPDLLSNEELLNHVNEQYPEVKEIDTLLNQSTLESVENTFNVLVSDPEVYDYMRDDKHNHEMYQRAFDNLRVLEGTFQVESEKPSFFIPFAPVDIEILERLTKHEEKCMSKVNFSLRKEQLQVFVMLDFLISQATLIDAPWISYCKFVKDNMDKCFKHKTEVEIFNTGLLTGSIEEEMQLSQKYNEYKTANKGTISKRVFFKKFYRI